LISLLTSVSNLDLTLFKKDGGKYCGEQLIVNEVTEQQTNVNLTAAAADDR